MTLLTWTNNPPDQPGYYWVNRGGKIFIAEITKSQYSDESLFLWLIGVEKERNWEDYKDAQWMGPIEIPSKENLPSIESLAGKFSEFTGDLTSEQYVRSLRGI